jgi:hypothetical protein
MTGDRREIRFRLQLEPVLCDPEALAGLLREDPDPAGALQRFPRRLDAEIRQGNAAKLNPRGDRGEQALLVVGGAADPAAHPTLKEVNGRLLRVPSGRLCIVTPAFGDRAPAPRELDPVEPGLYHLRTFVAKEPPVERDELLPELEPEERRLLKNLERMERWPPAVLFVASLGYLLPYWIAGWNWWLLPFAVAATWIALTIVAAVLRSNPRTKRARKRLDELFRERSALAAKTPAVIHYLNRRDDLRASGRPGPTKPSPRPARS